MSYRNATSTAPEKPSEFRTALPQIVAVSIKNFFLLGIGMTLSLPTILIADLIYWEDKIKVTQEDLSWIGSIGFLLVPLGCLVSGPVFSKLGVKTSLQLANVPLVAILFLVKFAHSLWHVHLGLGVLGLVFGFVDAPATFYVCEISSGKLRSFLSSLTPMSLALGQLLTFGLSLVFTWRDVALITGLLHLLSVNVLLLLPSSPEWLIAAGRRTEARQVLSRLRGFVALGEVEEEFKEVEKGMEFEVWGFGVVRERRFYGPVAVGVLLGTIGAFGGIAGVGTFTVEVLRGVKSPLDKYLGMFLFGACQFLGVAFYVGAVRFLGKRKLTFIALTVSGFSLLLVALFGHLNLPADAKPLNLNPTWIPTAALLTFTFFTSATLKTLPHVYLAEIHSKPIRTSSAHLTISLTSLTTFLSNKLFLFLSTTLTLPGLLLIFSGVTLLSLIPLHFLLCETQWMSPQERQELYADPKPPTAPPNLSETQRNSLEDSLQFNFLLANGPNTYKGFSVIDSSVI